jgi:hypothetical protein
MTAGMVRVTNRVTPGSDTREWLNPTKAYGDTHQLMTAGVVHVNDPVTPGSE